jgi:polysaccharide biosynthesis protein PslA
MAFLLKAGASFSRAQFLIGLALTAILIAGARMLVARRLRLKAGMELYADLHIYDGISPPHPSGELVIAASGWHLAHDRGDSSSVKRLGAIAHGMDSVVVHCRPEDRGNWALALRTLDVTTEIVTPEIGELMPLSIVWRGGHASVLINSGQLLWNQRLIKRLSDLLIVIALAPGMLIIFTAVAAAIKLDSPGPVFFRQERIGIGNRPFRIWKFRSMSVAGQDNQASCLTARDDARITRVGAFIRKTSLDELPQLLNVLAGEMSVVGPRPHAIAAKAGSRLYWEVDQAYWQRHVVKPGITGLAQIRGFRGNTFREVHLRNRLEADLEYVARWSLALDLKILMRTLGVMRHENAF